MHTYGFHVQDKEGLYTSCRVAGFTFLAGVIETATQSIELWKKIMALAKRICVTAGVWQTGSRQRGAFPDAVIHNTSYYFRFCSTNNGLFKSGSAKTDRPVCATKHPEAKRGTGKIRQDIRVPRVHQHFRRLTGRHSASQSKTTK